LFIKNEGKILSYNKTKIRRLSLISLLIITPLGLLTKFYNGPAESWINHYAGDILYQIFWCLVLFFFFPTRSAIGPIPILVFIFNSIIEFLQLWKPPFLEGVRYTFLGKLTLGTQFDWQDFIYYLIGSFIGWLWLRQIWQKGNKYEKTS
jgi:hypothetical protein